MLRNLIISIFTLFILFLPLNFADAQYKNFPIGKGSTLLSGAINFNNRSGNLYGDVTTITITPSLFYFFGEGLGLGGDFSLDYISEEWISVTNLAIGPKFAYFIGKSNSKIYPYFGAGISFLSMNLGSFGTASGFRIKIGGGVSPLIGSNATTMIEAGYQIDNLTYDGNSSSGGILYIGIGIGCFIF